MDVLCVLCFAFASVHCCLVVTCLERADLYGSCWWCLLYFCYFPLWYPGLGVVLDCIFLDLCHLSYFDIYCESSADIQMLKKANINNP